MYSFMIYRANVTPREPFIIAVTSSPCRLLGYLGRGYNNVDDSSLVIVCRALKIDRRHAVKFAVTGGICGYHNNNLRCHQWWQRWLHDKFRFSVMLFKTVPDPLLVSRYFEYINGPLTRYAKLGVAHALGMSGTFSPPPRVSDPDMHHGTCVTHVPWCMPGWQTSGFLWIRWLGNRSRHSRRMRNPQFCVSGKRSMASFRWYGLTAIRTFISNHIQSFCGM